MLKNGFPTRLRLCWLKDTNRVAKSIENNSPANQQQGLCLPMHHRTGHEKKKDYAESTKMRYCLQEILPPVVDLPSILLILPQLNGTFWGFFSQVNTTKYLLLQIGCFEYFSCFSSLFPEQKFGYARHPALFSASLTELIEMAPLAYKLYFATVLPPLGIRVQAITSVSSLKSKA